jgi:hypothetical protein
MSDYLELPLYLEQDEVTDIWVYTEPNKFFVIKDVNQNPIRYEGWWNIAFIQYNRYASVRIEESKVMYFVTIENKEIPPDLPPSVGIPEKRWFK